MNNVLPVRAALDTSFKDLMKNMRKQLRVLEKLAMDEFLGEAVDAVLLSSFLVDELLRDNEQLNPFVLAS